MALRNLFQLLAARETDAGTVAPGLVASANAGLVINPTLTYNPEAFTREVVRGSLSPSAPLAGAIPATCTFGVEVAAVSSGTPFWHLLLEACGFKKWTLSSIDSGTLTNGSHTVPHVVTNDTFDSGATTVLADKFGNASATEKLYYNNAGAAFAGTGSISGTSVGTPASEIAAAGFAFTSTSQEVITIDCVTGASPEGWAVGDLLIGATSGTVLEALDAVAASTADAQDVRFRVLSGGAITGGEDLEDASGVKQGEVNATSDKTLADVPTISLALIEDGRMKVMRGARGNVTFSAGNIGEPVILNFTFTGAFSSVSDRTAFPAVTFNAQTPPVTRGAIVTLGSDDASFDAPAEYVTPCIASFTIDAGNTVATRRCMDDTSGVLNAAITGRQGTLTFDPEIAPEAFFPFLDQMTNNNGFRFNLEWGSVSGDGATFALKVPDCQTITETVGDREGVATDEYTANIGARLPEDNGDGSDRDITFLHITDDTA